MIIILENSNLEIQFIDDTMRYHGIYMLLNQKNWKFYIGSAVNIFKRVSSHINALKANNHVNKHLQNAWNKDNEWFIFILLEIVENKEDLIQREQFWFDKTECYKSEYGYNLAPVAGSSLGVKLSLETRQKMSESRKGINGSFYGKHHSEETKKLIRFKLSGKNSVWYGRKHTEETLVKLREKAKGENNGFYNKSHSEYTKELIRQKHLNKKQSPEHIEERIKNKRKSVLQFSLDGKLIKDWKSVSSVGQDENFSAMGVSRCCNGLCTIYKGFMWKFKTEEF